jgi:hypothetical protein
MNWTPQIKPAAVPARATSNADIHCSGLCTEAGHEPVDNRVDGALFGADRRLGFNYVTKAEARDSRGNQRFFRHLTIRAQNGLHFNNVCPPVDDFSSATPEISIFGWCARSRDPPI